MELRRTFTLILVGLSMFFAFGERAVAAFPPLTGRVVDQANILSTPVKLEIVSELERFEGVDQGPQLVVVTVDSLEGKSIEDYTLDLGRHWGIGHAGKDNGIILLIAPHEREVRIEVGYGLEGVLTDAATNEIIRNVLVPELKNNNWDAAAKAGVNAIIEEVQSPHSPSTSKASNAEESEFFDWWFVVFFLFFIFFYYVRYVFVLVINLVLTILFIAPLNAILWLFGYKPIAFKGLPLPSKAGKDGGFWGGFGGGGGGGGGFSGGGGSFGGGGSSGRF